MADDQDQDRAREAEWRWGETDAYKESARRTKRYGPEEWAQSKAEARDIELQVAQKMAEGVPASDPAMLKLVEAHRLHIDKWFYPLDHWMHAQLAEGYVTDDRFRAHYDEIAPGLAEYLAEAIEYNALLYVDSIEQDSALSNAKAARGLSAPTSDAIENPHQEDVKEVEEASKPHTKKR